MSNDNNEVAKEEIKEKQFFLVDGDLLNAVANFLRDQKYREVAGMVDALKQSRPVKVQEQAPIEVASGPGPKVVKED